MAGSVNMFNIGKSGLQATKSAMTTTGHNIANVNSEGYSRQNVEVVSGPTIPAGRLTFGTGAWTKSVDRVNDEYLDKRIHVEARNMGNIEEKSNYLEQTEQIFNEAISEGMNRITTNFFNEFRKLSTDPENEAVRASVREASKQLVDEVRRMDRSLKDVQANIDNRVEGYVRDVNALSKEIRDLNLMIQKTDAEGSAAPDLHDKRDLALKKLGAIVDISVSKDKNSRITVTMGGHVPLVCGEQLTELSVVRTPADPKTGKREGRLDIYVNEPVPSKLTTQIKTGRLGGLLEVRDKDITQSQDEIDQIAHAVSEGVNAIHVQGFGKDGGTGRLFFKQLDGVTGAAEHIDLSDDVKENLGAIAAAKDPNSASDNRVAIAISGLESARGLLEGGTITDKYNSMVSEMGVKTEAAKKATVFQKDVLTQLETVRESLVGVNLDEETSNLIRFQHAYAANAKVLSVADEMMQTVLGTFKG